MCWSRFLDKTGRTGSTFQFVNGLCLLLAFFGVRIVYGGLMVSTHDVKRSNFSDNYLSRMTFSTPCTMYATRCRLYTFLYMVLEMWRSKG